MSETIDDIRDAIAAMWAHPSFQPTEFAVPLWQYIAIGRGTMRKRAFRRWRGKRRAGMRNPTLSVVCLD